MTKYFQCSKDKVLKSTSDTPDISEIVCCDRRMRLLTKDQYDHEVAQRDYVENGGDVPAGTALMTNLNI